MKPKTLERVSKRPELMGFINSLSCVANLDTSNELQAAFWISGIFSDP